MKFLRTIVVVCALLHPCITTYAAARYTITDLGTLGGATSHARGINSSGWVVGYSKNSSGYDNAFLWKPNHGISNLGSLGGLRSYAYAINDNGQVTGSADPEYGESYAFLWSADGAMTALPRLQGYGCGRSINRQGQVAGSSYNSYVFEAMATLWTPGVGVAWVGVDVPGREYGSLARGINDSGTVVGQSYVNIGDSMFFVGWFLMSNGYGYGLPGVSDACAVNADNQIVGRGGSGDHPVLWNWYMYDLGTFGGSGSAYAINDRTQVVGYCNDAGGTSKAFVWEKKTGILDLNALIDPSSGWMLSEATGINNNGWIVGNGTINGQTHGFLLTPIPEPGSLLVLGSGLVGLLAFRRRNR